MDGFENQTYERLKYEFGEELNRDLTEDEKDFLQWLAVKHAQTEGK